MYKAPDDDDNNDHFSSLCVCVCVYKALCYRIKGCIFIYSSQHLNKVRKNRYEVSKCEKASHITFMVYILLNAKHIARTRKRKENCLLWSSLQPKLQRDIVRWAVPDTHPAPFTRFSGSHSGICHRKS
ncbi:hypothetical protein HJG60_011530 [Phyllostomus discolor]|uniref:Uncharacterized protein n=1 Tax=Phyllostomus discolor TaxID=89673 RepID=A0A833ZNQ4_9CHIR|nr:hypothetical protein HJG60_011530 [Phyllostomus discolor]